MLKKFYFEIAGMAQDNKGNDLPAYMSVTATGPYDADAARAIAAEKLHISEARIKEISEEEYTRNMGAEDDGQV